MRTRRAPTRICGWRTAPSTAARPSQKFWTCEFPYPTMRLDGPGPECAGCPVWEEIERARARLAESSSESEDDWFVAHGTNARGIGE